MSWIVISSLIDSHLNTQLAQVVCCGKTYYPGAEDEKVKT